MKVHELGKRKVKRLETITEVNPQTGTQHIALRKVEREEAQPILDEKEAVEVPAELWTPVDSLYGKFMAVYQERRFFTDTPPKKKAEKKDDK